MMALRLCKTPGAFPTGLSGTKLDIKEHFLFFSSFDLVSLFLPKTLFLKLSKGLNE